MPDKKAPLIPERPLTPEVLLDISFVNGVILLLELIFIRIIVDYLSLGFLIGLLIYSMSIYLVRIVRDVGIFIVGEELPYKVRE